MRKRLLVTEMADETLAIINVSLWQLCVVGLNFVVITQICSNDGENLVLLSFQYLKLFFKF